MAPNTRANLTIDRSYSPEKHSEKPVGKRGGPWTPHIFMESVQEKVHNRDAWRTTKAINLGGSTHWTGNAEVFGGCRTFIRSLITRARLHQRTWVVRIHGLSKRRQATRRSFFRPKCPEMHGICKVHGTRWLWAKEIPNSRSRAR